MDRPGAVSRTSQRRSVLQDGSSQANIHQSTSSYRNKVRRSHLSIASSSSTVPHHESVQGYGGLSPQTTPGRPGPEDKRLSALTTGTDSKRNSQISTTSSQATAKGRRRKTHIGPWLLGGDLGKGGVGKVRKVRHAVTGETAAAKIISKKVAERARAESLANLVESTKSQLGSSANPVLMPFGVEREVVIMKLLNHPNIVKLYDIWENRNELYLVMEYVDGGELFDYIDSVGKMEENETVWVLRQILAALLHCHRLGIHHRDLKPENILLDNKDSPTVKLVDFGMAALQPQGKLLTTPCGSFHYAAPEVFEKYYDGSKADVWSLGIILYVMLTGSTPFVFDNNTMKQNTQLWYNIIKRGKFHMPEELSPDAKDLLSRMLVPDAKKRISLENTWRHPFIQNYNRLWSRSETGLKIEDFIGARPTVENWTIRHERQIDREILWNLRMLWHSEKEETLVKKLLNNEPNQEKYFYGALQKFREDQLENYVGIADAVGYSSSDYHHIKPVEHAELPPIPPSAYTRTKSQFSILDDNDKPVRSAPSRSSFNDPAPSEGSYDPYRASRSPIVTGKPYSVTVHRGQSHHSRKKSNDASYPPTSLRQEVLKKQQHHLSITSSKSSLYPTRPLPRQASKATLSRASLTRTSLTSSNFASSPPQVGTAAVVRPASRYRRPVQFSHSRKGSRASTQASLLPTTPSARPTSKASSSAPTFEHRSPSPSPAPPTAAVRSRKGGPGAALPPAKARIANESVDVETRKVSAELEKFCEDVFYRSSGQTSRTTSSSQSKGALAQDTPPSSVSRGDTSSYDRPLPDLPHETPNTYLVKELAETRKKLIERYANNEVANTSTYQDVLSQLDSLLFAGESANRRIVSAPEPHAQLPVISEESRALGLDDSECAYEQRRASEPSSKWPPSVDPSKTIRAIDTSSPVPAPLNIRKVSGGSIQAPIVTKLEPHAPASASSTANPAAHNRFYPQNFSATTVADRKTSATSPISLDTISEEGGSSKDGDGKSSSRMRNWFGRSKKNALPEKPADPARAWDDLDDRTKNYIVVPTSRSASGPSSPAHPPPPETKTGFFSFLRGKRQASHARMALGVDEDDDTESIDSANTASVDVPNAVTRHSASGSRRIRKHQRLEQQQQQQPLEMADLGVQQNWFARFFNIKPVTKVMCFSRGRGTVRQELVRLMRSWRIYGMKDVYLDRGRNLIWGRLASGNYLGIKEVLFVIELFVVLEQGKRAGLSLARFTQRKGAASSFRRVTETVEEVLSGKGLLVTDEQRRRDMENILTW